MRNLRSPVPFFASTPALIFLALFVAIMLVNSARSLWIGYNAQQEQDEVRRRVQLKEREVRDLEARIRAIESGEGVDIEARSRLNLQRPDEHVLVILDEEPAPEASASTTSETLWGRVKSWFSF